MRSAVAKAYSLGRQRVDSAVGACAPTPLRCSRPRPAAELASFAALTALGQPRQVRGWSALPRGPRSLRFSALHTHAAVRANTPLRNEPACSRRRRHVSSTGRRVRVDFAATLTPPIREVPPSAGADGRGGRHSTAATCAAASSAVPQSPRASRAHHKLTRRGCLSAVSAANEASSATRLRDEQRSGVGAARRPPRREPRSNVARRDSQPQRQRRTNAACRDVPWTVA